jgi:hypothetical protein
MATSFNVNINDLQYILKQIKIAEATSAAYSATPKTILQAIMDAYGVTAANAAQLPAGLRTVDGTFNNLLPGRSEFGAADTLFPRLTDPNFQNVNGPGIDFNGDGIVDVTNHNYGDTNGAAPGGVRSVADADPRMISNLIVDMSLSNPAAVEAYLNNPLSADQFAADHPGLTMVIPIDAVIYNNPVALAEWQAAHAGLIAVNKDDIDTPAELAAWLLDPLNAGLLPLTNLDMKTIPNQSPDIGLSPGFNSWMTFFGQFFDHGLDLVTKGSNGTVYVPLAADDPLYDKGADGTANNVVNAFFVTDPAASAPGTLPAVSGDATAWQAFYLTDPADRPSYPPGAFAPAMTATPTAFLVKFNDDGAGADGLFSTADDRPNFMALTRATATMVAGDANGDGVISAGETIAQAENTTTSWIDQNQTYTSHASHQVFLREYTRIDTNGIAGGDLTVSTGNLIDGAMAGSIGNWGEVKAQALTMLGINLSDFDVHNVPLLLTDQYGKFIPGANGFAQIVMKPDTLHSTYWFKEGNSDGSVTTAGAETTGHAFLNDIAHHAAPGKYDADGDGFKESFQTADVNPGVGDDGLASTYDDEMLNAHFITGDGRGNENIALTSVHSIFHSEHNRLVEVNKATVLSDAQAKFAAATTDAGKAAAISFLNEWLNIDVPATMSAADVAALTPTGLIWDGERLFQAARFGTEMQYQHLVFEEFARRIQPNVDPFIFNSSPDIDPSIVAEFAHTVYRFGHSMLTGTVDRLDNNLDPINGVADQESLLAAFLNPQLYAATGTTAAEANANLIRALSRDVGNALDEFIVPDVRSTLLGLPLDLAALNIARGRETGIPSLNETRKQLYEGASAPVADLKPYESWADFGANLKNPASLVNFMAAYGSHATIASATTLADMRSAAAALVQGAINVAALGSVVPADLDAYDFVHALGAYAGGTLGGLNTVDLWIGGLAEAHPEFGGMLGSTFNYIFEFQMEQLQFGDRMYYLTRTQGLNILNNLEPNTFSDLVMRNTDLGDVYATHLNGALFVTPDYFLELDRKISQEEYGLREYNGIDKGSDPTWSAGEAHGLLTPYKVIRNYTGTTQDVNGHDVGASLRFTGGEHVVVGGTEGNDKIWTDRGIDTIWGDGGNDYINAGTESDDVFGGLGDDIIEDPFGDDVLRGNQGNDVISDARGANLIFGDEGSDYIMQGQDASEAFGGEGNDFILGGAGKDFLLGNEGDDWIEGGAGFDTIAGDNSELFFNSTIIGHDVLFHGSDEGDYDAESGDDIMGSGPSVFRYEGMFGFDWGIAKNDITGVNFDLQIPIFTTIANDILKDRFDQVEALSGWKYSDVLDGDDRGHKGGGSSAPDSVPVELFADHLLTQEGIDRIAGFQDWFGGYNGTTDLTDVRNTLFGGFSGVPGSTPITTWRDGNILMGGDGSDFLRGRGGYDLIDGDTWLNVRIKIMVNGVEYSAESMSTDTVLSGDYAGRVFNTIDGKPDFTSPAFGGATLNSLMLNGTINPGNMSIVRELLTDTTDNHDVDTAIFQGQFYEYQIEGEVDLNGDGDFDDINEFGVINDINADGDTLDVGEYNTTARDVNGDGFISVRDRDTGAVGASHNSVAGASSRGNLTDDTDYIKNIEQLQFADGIKVITGGNHLATGIVTISDPTPYDGLVTPYVGQVLTASLSNVADIESLTFDVNGNPVGLTFEWQTTEFGNNSGWSTITTGVNYTVRSVDPGHVLRAVAVFNDNAGNPERIASVSTDNPTAAFSVFENSVSGTVVGARIPFSIDYDPTSFNGNPPPDVDLATLFHQIDPANTAGGRFKVVQLPGQFDFQGTPLFQIQVDQGGPVLLDYEALQAPVDNEYQIVINSYTADPANGGVLVAVRQFTILLKDVDPEIVNIAPVITFPAAVSMDENTLLVGTVTATDPDGPSALAYSITGGADATKFSINASTGELTFNAAPNYEAPGDVGADNVYNVDVSVSDGLATTTQSMAVTVGNVNEAATGGVNISMTNYTANPAIIAQVTLNAVNTLVDGDLPGGVTPAYTWTRTSGAGSALPVNGTGPSLTVTAGLAVSTYTLSGSYTDAFGNVTVNAPETARIGTNFGNDTINGGANSDLIFGLGGNDTLNGTGGNDLLNGGDGNDIMNGGADNDDLVGGNGNDTMTGGAGNDNLNGGGGAADVANFTGALTNFSFDTQGGADIIVNDTTGVEGTDRINGAETLRINGVNYAIVTGGNGVDAALNGVNGAAGSQAVFGFAGNDLINGGAGNDIIHGGDGDDTITQAAATGGRDIVDGGANATAAGDRFILNGDATNEAFRVYSRAEALLAGLTVSAGTEIVITRNGTTNANVVAELDNVEEITINTGGGVDTVTPIGSFNPTSLNYNTITVNDNGGRVTVDASQLTSAHHIALNAGGHNDTFIGQRAQDEFNVNPLNPVNGTAGSDTNVRGTGGDDLINSGLGNDTARGGSGDDTFVASANDGSDRYYGDGGNDTIDMSAVMSNVFVNLNDGKATVTDRLYSIENAITGAGDDTITASRDHNMIDTGTGHDTIVFRSAAHADGDTIVNFEAGDKIDVNGIMKGHLSLVSGPTSAAGQIAISYDDHGGNEVTVLNGTDAMGRHFEIDIKGHHNLTGADFAA